MRIGVTLKVKNFEIDPIFAKKILKQTYGGGEEISPLPQRGIGLIAI